MSTPKVTIYIPSHNYGKFLEHSIESVLRQNYDSWELLLFNDNSTDNTQEIIDLYVEDPRITAYKTEGIGLPKVANLALKYSKGEYLIRLDGDDIFDENIILVLSNLLDRNPKFALVFPDYYLIDDHGGIYSEERRAEVFHNNHVMDVPAHGACTMIRKKVLHELGGYREDLGAQDGFDLWSKLAKNYPCGNVNIPLFYYRQHGDNLTGKKQRIFNARREIKKSMTGPELGKHRPVTAVIPCRKKFDIYPDLWNQKIDNDNTLLDISIKNCLSIPFIENIIITSDTEEVNSIIKKYNDSRLKFIGRPSELTIRSKPITLTLNHIIDKLNLGQGGIFLLAYIQAPFISSDSIEECIHTLIMHDADSSFAVEEIENNLFKRGPHGLYPINNNSRLRSDFDTVYSDARTCVAVKNKVVRSGSLTGSKIVNFAIPKEESFFIGTRKDFEIAKLMKGLEN